jgi:hypothetical protein
MVDTVAMISVLSVIPALVLAILKFWGNDLYRPFCFLIFLGGIIDISSLFTGNNGINNLGFYNILILSQYCLIIYQLFKWGFFNSRSYTSFVSIAIITILWTVETYKHSLTGALNQYSLMFSSFFIVIFITIFINRLIFEKLNSLIIEARFLIAIGLLIYFTSNLIVFIFAMPQFEISRVLFIKIWSIHDIINAFTNLIFAVGLLCIKKK